MADTIRILSIDGGGIRGIIPATVLGEILGGRRAQDVFHMIAGTSTGGIIACGLCKPNPLTPNALIDLYAKHGSKIFKRPLIWSFPGSNLLEEKYDSEELEAQLLRILGDTFLSEVVDVDLLVPSYAIELAEARPNGETRAPMFFNSWRARGEGLTGNAKPKDYDFPLREVALATSAAPTYFEPAAVKSASGQVYGMIDGGVFANNPAMCALAAAYQRYGINKDYVVVSLGTGFLQRPIPLREAKGWGLAGWARPILSVLMDGSADTVAYQLDQIPGTQHFRFDIPLGVEQGDRHGVNDDFDDASPANIQALKDKAQDLIKRQAAGIKKAVAALAGKKQP
jgi:patatin-like phospholipase/acyl hydrolase